MEPAAKRRRVGEEETSTTGGAGKPDGTGAPAMVPAVDAGIQQELKDVFNRLKHWFEGYGHDSALEIEARLKNIEEHEFQHIVRSLDSFKGWSQRYEETTMDIRYGGSGIRETIAIPVGSKPSVYLAKETMEKADYSMPDGLGLRVTVNAEDHCAPPLQGDYPDSYRHKHRIKFVHRNEVAYDCTIVRMSKVDQESAMKAKPEFEVEIEWCGQDKVAEAKKAKEGPYCDPALLAAKFTLKVQDLHGMRRQARTLQAQAQQMAIIQQQAAAAASSRQHHYTIPALPPPAGASHSSAVATSSDAPSSSSTATIAAAARSGDEKRPEATSLVAAEIGQVEKKREHPSSAERKA
jgi:hypothetical protein